jgi:isocitrate dehydrogenase
LSVSLEDLGQKAGNPKALILAKALDEATCRFLDRDRSPLRKVGEVDSRGSHYYIATYWAEYLATQDEDAELKTTFTKLNDDLAEYHDAIIAELRLAQGKKVDLGGYYHLDTVKTTQVMRPSQTLNRIIDAV